MPHSSPVISLIMEWYWAVLVVVGIAGMMFKLKSSARLLRLVARCSRAVGECDLARVRSPDRPCVAVALCARVAAGVFSVAAGCRLIRRKA